MSLPVSKTVFASVVLAVLVGLCLSACGPSPEERFSSLEAAGQKAFAGHDYATAIGRWEAAIAVKREQPPPASLYLRLAEAYQRRAEPGNAQIVIREGLEAHPRALDLLILDARLDLNFAAIDKAKGIWEQQIKPHPSPAGDILAGDIATLEGDLTAAEASYRQALAKAPDNQTAMIRLAICRLGRHHDRDAATIFAALRATGPTEPRILAQMGDYRRLAHETPQALRLYQQARAADPGDLTLGVKLAEFHLVNGETDKAINILAPLRTASPNNHLFIKITIEALLRGHRFDEAEKEIDHLFSLGAPDVESLLLKGKFYLQTGRASFAVSQFAEAIKKEANLPTSHYWLAMSYLADHKPSLAQQSAIKALALDPYSSETELLLADIFYSKQEFDTAAEHAKRIMRREPENPRPYMILGAIALQRGAYNKAMTAFRKAMTLSPAPMPAAYHAALAMEQKGEPRQALALYRTLFTQAPRYTEIARRYLTLLPAGGLEEKEWQFLLSLPAAPASRADLHEIIGQAALANGDPATGVRHLRQALVINPEQTGSYLRLADYYEQQRDWPRFIDILTQAVAHGGGEAATLRLAGHYLDNGQYDAAMALIDKGLEREPESPRLANCKAWILLVSGADLDQALILAQKAYDALPDDPAVIDTLGWAYYHKKMLTRARWLEEEALKKAPRNPILLYHIGAILAAAGERKKGDRFLRQALRFGIKKPYKEEIEQILATLSAKETP